MSQTHSICRPVTSINIRGHQCNNGTAPFWTLSNHFHVDSSYESDDCSCTQWIDSSVDNEDNFGQYYRYNTNHSCSASNESTTNFWIGSSIHSVPTTAPSLVICPFSIFHILYFFRALLL